jgi:hypothetical protein
MAIEETLASIADVLVLAKNGSGEVYWPEVFVNKIGDMQPGQGYKIYLSEDSTLVYPPN